MKALFAFLGVLILLAGGAALIHPRFSTPSKKKEVQIENHKVIFESKRFFTVPPIWGGVAVVAGGLLIFLGMRR
jgi:hypothetical protein